MTDTIIMDEFWLPLALDVLGYAKKHKTVEEFKKFASIQPVSLTQNPHDRLKILDYLLDRELIIKDPEGFLRMGVCSSAEWLTPQLELGEKSAWILLETAFPDSLLTKKFDDTNNKKIGLLGEQFIISELWRTLKDGKATRVKHVSQKDDAAGFDIHSPVNFSDKSSILLEVKTTSKPTGKFRFFISRNEFNVSQKYANWYLVFVRIINGSPILEGHLGGHKIKNLMPEDNAVGISSWHSALLNFENGFMNPGLPID